MAARDHLAVCGLPHGYDGNNATVYGHHGSVRTCIRVKGTDEWVYDPGWEEGGVRPPDRTINVPRPRITTGPAHLTMDEASAMYLREAAVRVRRERYWGSGVTLLVSDLLDHAADALDPDPAIVLTGCRHRFPDGTRCTLNDAAHKHTPGLAEVHDYDGGP